MHTTARLRVAASIVAITLTAACGSDSTAPQSPSQVASHFDSLFVEADNRSDTVSAYGSRAALLTLFEVPPALGASPASISVTTANGVEHWKAFEFDDLFNSGTDSTFFFMAYREADAHTVIVIQFNGDGSINDGVLITNDTLAANITDGGGSTTLLSTSGSCGAPSASLLNPAMNNLFIASCTLAKFRTSLTLTSQTSAHIDPALASITMNAVSVNGVRVIDQVQGGALRHAREVLRASRVAKHL
jgi:hypothetical protein